MKRINISLFILFTIFSFFSCQFSKDKKLREMEMAEMVIKKFSVSDSLMRDTCLRALTEFLGKDRISKYSVLHTVLGATMAAHHEVFIREYRESYDDILKQKVDTMHEKLSRNRKDIAANFKGSEQGRRRAIDMEYDAYDKQKLDTLLYYIAVAYHPTTSVGVSDLLRYQAYPPQRQTPTLIQSDWLDNLKANANVLKVCEEWSPYYESIAKYDGFYFYASHVLNYWDCCKHFKGLPRNVPYYFFYCIR